MPNHDLKKSLEDAAKSLAGAAKEQANRENDPDVNASLIARNFSEGAQMLTIAALGVDAAIAETERTGQSPGAPHLPPLVQG